MSKTVNWPVNRIVYLLTPAALLLVAAPALAQHTPTNPQGQTDMEHMQSMPRMPSMQDNVSALEADCGSPNLNEAAIDSCLERARVIDETNPSPDIEALEAQLEQRAHTQFNPNGVDQAATNSPRSLAPANDKLDIPIVRSEADDPPPQMPEDSDEVKLQDHQKALDLGAAANNDDVPPVQDPDTDQDDSKTPDTNTDDPPPPDNPPADDVPPKFE